MRGAIAVSAPVADGFRLGVREAAKAARSAAVMPHVNWERFRSCSTVLSSGSVQEKVRLLVEISGPSFRLTEGVAPVTHDVDERLSSLALTEVLQQSGAVCADSIVQACCAWIDTGAAAGPGQVALATIGALVEHAEQRLGLLARFAPALGAAQALHHAPEGLRENLRMAQTEQRERAR